MTVTLYISQSEPNRVDKKINEVFQLTGNLRDSTSIINPTIVIETTENLSVVNYAYIPEFGRYYFVRNIGVIRNNLWQLDCHVDVLMSFKDFYKSLPCVVARNERQYNLFLPDDRFLVNANRNIQTKQFPNSPSFSGGSSYIITLAGGATADT